MAKHNLLQSWINSTATFKDILLTHYNSPVSKFVPSLFYVTKPLFNTVLWLGLGVGLTLPSKAQTYSANPHGTASNVSMPYSVGHPSMAKTWLTTLPAMDNGSGLIEQQQSQQLGEYALRQINAEAPLIRDPWLQQSLENIVWQINAVARADAPMALVVINDPQINAFAVPAGLIGMNIGLIDKAQSLDEMASVISHEIAHVSQRHYQYRNDEKTKQLLMQLGGIAAGVVAAKAGEGNAGAAVMMGSQAMMANTAAQFSRDQEREADRVGMQIMAQAGYDVNAMPSFFATLNQQNPVKRNAFIPSFIMSHPLTAERLSEARERTSLYPKPNPQSIDNQNRRQLFDQIQWRAKYLAHLTNLNELTQAARTSNGAKLALAMQLMDERQFDQASKVLLAFENDIRTLRNPLAVMVTATLEQRQGKFDQAISRLTQLANVLPERRDIKLLLADIYLTKPTDTLNNAKTVQQLLQPLTRQFPKDINLWQRLEQASEILAKNPESTVEDKTLQQINMLRYRAYREFWQNSLSSAITSLTQADNLAKTLPYNTAILATIHQQIAQVQQANAVKIK